MHRRHLLAIGLAALARPTFAAPTPYRLGPNGATITYLFTLNGGQVKGTVPVGRADLRIDPDNLAASTADVTADIRRARTGLIFATEALKSESVLNAARFPQARFTSTRVTLGAGGRISDGATIDGDLTLRGVTRPVRFAAELYRKRGSAAGDLSALDVRLQGRINRSDFGATGYADLVDDSVGIDIRADIVAG
ncbi:YceI family protein [uncultured Tateyamaria sp.]|uniref:YceI family protein n=1 Tax=Tateyamaria sp. 1078 TaxID=3417464 RepID=UPI002608765C|nr:YceI family protein [uncultured Tateyamaria sp.]